MEDFDITQFRDKFIEDATTLLVQLETDLLALENDKVNNELIESVFRAMHTLKGVAGMYGFDKITGLKHGLMGASVKPGNTSPKTFNPKLPPLKIGVIQVGDFCWRVPAI